MTGRYQKASLRVYRPILAEGSSVKVVVLFPDGDDPDSFARTRSRRETAFEANAKDSAIQSG
ncbi:MAG: hypothetical protein IPP33_18930 [Flavobacteriales bacterium]|nr:hypothetical protein [Flavobacteriales bacterium]